MSTSNFYYTNSKNYLTTLEFHFHKNKEQKLAWYKNIQNMFIKFFTRYTNTFAYIWTKRAIQAWGLSKGYFFIAYTSDPCKSDSTIITLHLH